MSRVQRVVAAVCTVLFLAVQTAFPAAAAPEDEAARVLGQIFTQASSGDSFYDGTEYGGADRIVYCYTELYGSDGADGYIASAKQAADELMSSERFVKPTDLQKCAVALAHYGECTQELINAAVYLNTDFDKQGLNAYIWGLIALGRTDLAPPQNAVNTQQSIISYLLSQQLDDGGFALTGSMADCDITSAAIYALAPFRGDKAVDDAVDRAFLALKSIQLENGGFSSMGIENCDSAAQAIIAAACIGETDWVSESGALGALLSYRCDGGFSHLSDGVVNVLTTSQACSALTAYTLSLPQEVPEAPVHIDTHEADGNVLSETAEVTGHSGGDIKLIVVLICALAGIALAVIWMAGGRKRPFLLVAALICAVAGVAATFLEFSTPEEYYSQSAVQGISVTVTVDCSAAIENADKAADGIAVPLSPEIIAKRTVTVTDGSSALDALVEAARSEQLTIDYMDSWSGAYVRGIAGVYEFDFGSESGWLYLVNGESPACAMSEYILHDGDQLVVEYTCTLGRG